uniref:Carbamoyl phosphate synthase small chain n=1 Tax=Digenea simplex TaxID=945030 RepID=A0A1Z1MUN5_DIGSM|nr:carbamoyl phosphate synthase small subunit [Digenea simplex]ARW69445.1 carbamoyl phosphate synthase small subunit [Digenea simplex]
MSNTLYPSILYLQDGKYYKGWSFFKLSCHAGEIVFNTGMTGYQEIFSDPSYSGQTVIFTYPEIGNTGLNSLDNESSLIHIQGIVAKNISSISSNWRSDISLKNFILLKGIPHIFGIDTRSLTKHIRSYGVMNSVLCDSNYNISSFNFESKKLDKLDLIRKVTTENLYYTHSMLNMRDKNRVLSNYRFGAESQGYPENKYEILVIDFGLKFNIIRKLASLGCKVYIIPATSSYQTILKYKPDGILLSNGPGDPTLATYAINTIKKLLYFSKVPIFGICMGHQVLNIALGADTFKLKFGHRGLNHPCGFNNCSEITSQNHGFAVNQQSLLQNDLLQILSIVHLNFNDLTVSSTRHKRYPIFSVQYHPEASPGPHDSDYLFQLFTKLIDLIKFKS